MPTTLNVDHREIAKFEALASRWWDRNGEFKPLHDINPLRAGYIDQHSPVAGKRLLDVGCGGGILAESMAQRGAIVTGIDMGDAPLSVARIHTLESGIEVDYRQTTAEQLAAAEPASYDIVCCLEMLEHVPDPSAIIAACARLATPGGALYFSTLNRNPKAFLFAIVGAERILHLLPEDTHEYAKFIKPSELAGWIRTAELTMEGMTGLLYNPITKHYRLDAKDVSVNYMVHASKPE
ncbi:MAG: bifunctional 2-polyprenyl-6-hydroxyphenol methylase/3-demethylubiquinol 3-O-methyltransferase UbiG [Halieaceae bacterium]|mgnify:CR=1 FL=1|jgi:2-polyprenyl-6-hydroxyphenyl methylase / 3-demethylubiquinone-9 3-methyltransferase|nr:bifunctional 2-polyprenyl-6-hydroxyphenol methylase/3-demethylubiquinol 3-O-methyltransferase UbiG [Halieaceae bacterium]